MILTKIHINSGAAGAVRLCWRQFATKMLHFAFKCDFPSNFQKNMVIYLFKLNLNHLFSLKIPELQGGDYNTTNFKFSKNFYTFLNTIHF